MKKVQNISLDFLQKLLIDEQGIVPTKTDLENTEAALSIFAEKHGKQPPLSMRDKILSKMQRFDVQKQNRQTLNLHNLPILTAESNWLDWELAVQDIEPPLEYDNIHLHTLESNDTRDLFVGWVNETPFVVSFGNIIDAQIFSFVNARPKSHAN